MRIALIALFSMVFATNLLAQNLQRIDSLKELQPSRKGAEQFDILNSIAWEYRFVNPDSTIQYAQRAYALGKKTGLKKTLARSLNFIGVAHEYQGDAIEAYDYYKQALAVATSQGDELEIAYANNNTGRLFFDQGNISRSLVCYSIALKIFEHQNDSSGIAYVYLNLAQLYQYQKNLKKAEDYFLKVYNIRLQLSGTPNVSSILQLGLFYRECGQIIKSNHYFRQADSLCAFRNDEVSRAEVSILLAENRYKEDKLQEANDFAQRGFYYADKNNLSRDLSAAYLILGKISFAQNDLKKAKGYFEKVLTHTKPFRDVALKMDAHYFMGQIYSREGQKEQELRSKNQYLILRDSIKAVDLAKQIDRLKFHHQLELEQKINENKLLKTIEANNNTIIRKQQTLNIVYAGALVIIVIIAVLLFRSVTMKQNHNMILELKQKKIMQQSEALKISNLEIEKINENLEGLVHERTKKIKEQNGLLKEYAYFNAHQIRGPLARILGLISILHLEFNNDSFGPYMNMLSQAGNDLDAAIKEINQQLDKADD